MISTKLSESFKDVKKVKQPVIVTKVEMKPGRLMTTMAEAIMSELERMAPYSGYRAISELESEDICKYLKTLMWMRCCAVSSEDSKVYREYKKLNKHLIVPVLAYQLLIAIGEAYDADYAIRFYPEYQIEGEDLLSPDEMRTLSDVMCLFMDAGFQAVEGMPRATDGELDFMAMCHVEDVVVGYRQTHPVYGFLAAFFNQKKLNEITGTMCRVVYGYDSDYDLYVRQLVRKISAT